MSDTTTTSTSRRSERTSRCLEITTFDYTEVKTLRLARYILAQYIKLLHEARNEDEDSWLLPWGVCDNRVVHEDYACARSLLAAITPVEGFEDPVVSFECSYEAHARHVLMVAELIRDESDKEDEARRINAIYQRYEFNDDEEDARSILRESDVFNQEILDTRRPQSLSQAFDNLLSLQKIDEEAHIMFQNALICWELPLGLARQPDGKDDRRDRIDRTTSVSLVGCRDAMSILHMRAYRWVKLKGPQDREGEKEDLAVTAAAVETLQLNQSSPPTIGDASAEQGSASSE